MLSPLSHHESMARPYCAASIAPKGESVKGGGQETPPGLGGPPWGRASWDGMTSLPAAIVRLGSPMDAACARPVALVGQAAHPIWNVAVPCSGK